MILKALSAFSIADFFYYSTSPTRYQIQLTLIGIGSCITGLEISGQALLHLPLALSKMITSKIPYTYNTRKQ